MKRLTHISTVNDDQIAFGASIGIDLRGCTVSVALARIEDTVDVRFHGVEDLGSPSQKQVELGAKFGYGIAGLSRREGNAMLDDLMTQLNLETIEAQKLAPGVTVISIHDSLQRHRIVSSIGKDGTVYFRGGNGKRAWARNLRRVSD